MKFKLLALFCLPLALACSKEKSVPDAGPQFKLAAHDFSLAGLESALPLIKRDNPEDGPLIDIQYRDVQNINSIEKNLICGPLTLVGKKITTPDVTNFHFKLSNSEFPLLNTLPRRATCKLIVKLENKVGSTVQKEIQLRLNFDSNPALIARRSTASNGLLTMNGNGLLLIDTQEFKNPFSYSIRVSYLSSQTQCVVSPNYKSLEVSEPGLCSDAISDFKVSVLEIGGVYESLSGDMTTRADFSIPPGQTVVVRGFARFNAPSQKFASIYNRNVVLRGIFLTGCTDRYKMRTSAMANDFQSTTEDLIDPSIIQFAPGTISINNVSSFPFCGMSILQ